ncbi:MAG: pyridoxal phosphate-dependent aminotransferase [Myxococcales bacterium]|nr:pyridoxal phosphate-dependent aminotransferase [Myxococcales bacterium]MCB9707919.1 pyridoxal phosphate-dependent aminotransferase [Myxococcales bacterium]
MKLLPLAKRLNEVQESATVALAQRASALKRQGIDILAFGVGQPDFPTPDYILTAARDALQKSSHYTDVRGVLELRQAISEESKKRRGGISHRPDEIVVSVGAKHALFNLALALYDPGDEVIIPAPYWVSYPEQVRLVGAQPVIVPTLDQDNFILRPAALEQAITPRTKALILCTPSNPTGAAYTPSDLKALADVAKRHAFWIIVDEIYSQLVYDGFKQQSLLEVAPELKERLIIIDGVSKAYAMTGWRIGWMLGPQAIAKACDTIQGQATTNPATIAQYAAIAALNGDPVVIDAMRQQFEKRRTVLIEGINQIPGLCARMPDGAFYAFVDVRKLLGKRSGSTLLSDDMAVSEWLLDKARCAAVPGTPFGAPGFIRFSYATSIDTIEEGLRRIQSAVSELM